MTGGIEGGINGVRPLVDCGRPLVAQVAALVALEAVVALLVAFVALVALVVGPKAFTKLLLLPIPNTLGLREITAVAAAAVVVEVLFL